MIYDSPGDHTDPQFRLLADYLQYLGLLGLLIVGRTSDRVQGSR